MLRRERLTLPVLSAVALVLPAEGMDPAGIVSLAAPFALWWMIDRDGLDREAVVSAGAIPGSV